MPIATYVRGPERLGPRSFPAPKQASLRGWWNAIRRAAPGWELGHYPEGRIVASVDREAIVFEMGDQGTIYVSRRKGIGF